MSRNGQGYNYNIGVIGPGSSAALHADMQANLANWTVSSVTTFTDRHYWVLSNGTPEILCCMPSNLSTFSATAARTDSGSWEAVDSTLYVLWFSYAPNGGHTARLAAGLDPANTDYWSFDASPAIRPYGVKQSKNCNLWFISDNAREELHVYARSDDYLSYIGFGDQMIDANGSVLEGSQSSHGHLAIRSNSNGFNDITSSSTAQGWHYWWANNTFRGYGTSDITQFNSTQLNIATDTNQPGGRYATKRLPIMQSFGPYYGSFNPQHLRLTGRTTSTFKTIRGQDVDHKFIHLFQDVYTPWDSSLSFP